MEKNLRSSFVLAYQPNLQKITQIIVDGECEFEELQEATSLCINTGLELLPLIKEELSPELMNN